MGANERCAHHLRQLRSPVRLPESRSTDYSPLGDYTGAIGRGGHLTSMSNRSREVDHPVVLPVVEWPGGRASEQPQADAFMVNIEEIREAANGPPRLRAQSGAAIQQMLSRIVRGIACDPIRWMP